ncbi:VIT1/CCC1 transporter family protein [Lactiplantibacillus plantarum]|uniref:VIT1/CCC1 transporter family protein n=1 Tax=Lactiplantibacillus plantarum TaxID=1590 RepID=UPI003F537CCF
MQLTRTKSEKTKQTMDEKLNSLRAGVLGSNDGILTVVGVLFSVAAATTNQFTIFIAGLSDLLACAFSMASGEYASVSTQKDTEKAVVEKERQLLKTDFEGELHAVQRHYMTLGVTEETAMAIARDLLTKKPLATVVSIKYDMQLGHYMNPWDAAFASLFSASAGGVFPLLAMTFALAHWQWPATIIAVSVAVALTGYLSAVLGKGNVKTAVIRNVLVGIVTMFIHYYVGTLF